MSSKRAVETGIDILHFRRTIDSNEIKYDRWYARQSIPPYSPSQIPEFMQWKYFNPRRDNYKASNLDVPELTLAKAI